MINYIISYAQKPINTVEKHRNMQYLKKSYQYQLATSFCIWLEKHCFFGDLNVRNKNFKSANILTKNGFWHLSLFCILIVFSNSTFILAQDKVYLPNRIVKYYEYINAGEKLITKKKYKDAIQYYKRAFSTFDGFANDRYNALILCGYVNNNSLKKASIKFLYERNLCSAFFNQFNLNLEELSKLNRKSKKNKLKLNQLVLSKIDSLYLEDQNVRKMGQSIKKTDSLNFLSFQKIVNLYGFPSEKLIGVECSNNQKGIVFRKNFVLVKHFCQAKQEGMESILKNALLKNEVRCDDYVHFSSFLYSDEYLSDPLFIIDNEDYLRVVNDTARVSIDNARKMIGFHSIEDQMLKINFRRKNPDSRFRIPQLPGFINLNNYPKSAKESFKQNAIKINLELMGN